MFDSFLALPLHFTIEFLGFLICAAAAVLVASRPALIPGGPTSRGAATIGFAAVAVAQVAHGGSFGALGSDGDQVLASIKTFGFALVLIGVVGGVKARAEVAPAAAFTSDPVVAAPDLAAAAVALMALVSSFRGESRDLRKLALGTFLIAVGEAIVAWSPPGDAVLLSDTPELAAHLFRAAGFLWLGAWLWTSVRSSIRTRFVGSFVSLLLLVVLALSTALTGVITNNVEAGELSRVGRQLQQVRRGIVGTQVKDLNEEVRRSAVAVADDIQQGGDLNNVAGGVQQLLDVDYVLLTSGGRELLGRFGHGPYLRNVNNPEPVTDAVVFEMLGASVVRSVSGRGFPQGAADVARVGDYIAVISTAEVPRLGPEGNAIEGSLAGLLIAVDFIDLLDLTVIDRNVQDVAASIVVDDRLVATSGRRLQQAAQGRSLVPEDIREELAATFEPSSITRRQEIGGQVFYSAVTELRSTENLLGWLVLSSPSSLVAEAREGVTRTLFLVALGAGVIVLILAYYSGARITRPIQLLTESAQRVREGDLAVQTEVAGEDEVGQLGETFNEMTASLTRMTGDLRDAAREEHQLRSRIETIIQSMADGLVAVDADRRVLAFNREAEELTGVRSAAAVGQNVEDILDARNAQGEEISLPIFDLAEGSVANIFLMDSEGGSVPITVVSAVLRNEEGEIAGAVAVIRDMTREREVERMKSEFLSNISHELRTPLTPIKGYAEILSRKEMSTEKIQQFTRGILESTERLERIVELLVDFAALEAGRMSPRAASVDLAEMVKKLAEEWESRTPRHTVVADVGAKLPMVIGDERLLRRSLEEILDNAVKFSPAGGTITLHVKGAVRGNGHERRHRTRAVEVTVADEGIGIAPENLTRIFSDFQQLDGSETRSYGGLGLGLSFVRRIVEAHDGTVSVESRPEEGTRLTVSIPAASKQSERAR